MKRKSIAAAAIAVVAIIGLGVTSMAAIQVPEQQLAVPKAQSAIVDQIAPAVAPESLVVKDQTDITAQPVLTPAPSKAIPLAGVDYAAKNPVVQTQGASAFIVIIKSEQIIGVGQGSASATAAEVISSDQNGGSV